MSTNIKNVFVGVLGSEYPVQKIATKQTLEVANSHLTVRLPIFSVNQSMMQRHTIPNEKPIIEAISSFGISLTSFQEVSSKQRATLALVTKLRAKVNIYINI